MVLLLRNVRICVLNTPRGSFYEQIAVLRMAKDVMSRLELQTLIDKVSQPVL